MADVVMPQMGESIAEGTVIRWMKKVGDKVERDEPLFEISTDKVDAEIPSPIAGTVTEILAQEGQTVAVNSVVARVAAEGEAAQPAAPAAAESEAAAPAEPAQKAASESAAKEVQQEAPKAAEPAPAASAPQAQQPAAQAAAPAPGDDKAASLDERRKTRSSPLVRKIAKENDVDISQLEGSGVSGRVTKKDILQHLESPRPAQQQPRQAASSAPAAREGQMPAPAQAFGGNGHFHAAGARFYDTYTPKEVKERAVRLAQSIIVSS